MHWATSGTGEWFFLLRDHRTLRRHLGVECCERLPLFRHVVFVEDRFDGAFGHACFAVDAFVRMDVKNLLAFVEALHRANHHAIGVLAAKARFANDVRHETITPSKATLLLYLFTDVVLIEVSQN